MPFTLHKSLTKGFVLAALTLGVFGCNKAAKYTQNSESVSTFYFIRHAEKDRSVSDEPNPELNQDGLSRAIHWAEVFDPIELDAIYSTDYERTAMTAAPTSVKKNIEVSSYDPRNMDMETFLLENEGLNVLVVGHSNTTPKLVNLMLGKDKYPQMDDTDNGSLFIVRVIDGIPTDIRLQIN